MIAVVLLFAAKQPNKALPATTMRLRLMMLLCRTVHYYIAIHIIWLCDVDNMMFAYYRVLSVFVGRTGDRRLQLSAVNVECLVGVGHQPTPIASLPFVHTARRCYR